MLYGLVGLAVVGLTCIGQACAGPAMTVRPYSNVGTAMAVAAEMNAAAEACGNAKKTFYAVFGQTALSWRCE